MVAKNNRIFKIIAGSSFSKSDNRFITLLDYFIFTVLLRRFKERLKR